MKKIVIMGYYGFKNTGDEAILSCLITNIKKMVPDAKITVFSSDPEWTKRMYTVDAIFRYPKLEYLFTGLLERIKYLSNCDLLIIGGGGLYNDNWGKIPYGSFEMFMAKLFGKRIYVCGVGVGPYKSKFSRLLTGFFLRMADIITVRDKQSIKELELCGIKKAQLTADLALLLQPAKKEIAACILKKEGIPLKKLVGVCPTDWQGLKKQALAKALDKLIEEYDLNVLFIPFQSQYHDDRELSKKIISFMKRKDSAYVLKRDYAPQEILSIINELDFVIGIRLHSIIFATICNVPFTAIGYQPKVESLCTLFEDEKLCIPLCSLNFSNLYETLAHNYKRRQILKKKIKRRFETLKELSRINIDIIRELLN